MNFFTELKRRNVVKVALFYGIASWLIIQVAETVLPLFDVPEGVLRGVVVVLAIGFLPALAFSWAYELTPEGIKKESEIDQKQSIADHTGRKLNLAIVVLLVLAVGLLAYQQFALGPGPAGPAANHPSDAESQAAIDSSGSIAVLPFVNMSSDPEQEYFSDGMTEEILNTLVKVPGLLVTARTSTFSYKGRQEDVRSIGRELGVKNILEGSVRKAGRQLRITAQLVRVSDGFHLWSETYDRHLDNVFEIQEQIATSITQALKAPLGLEAGRLVPSRMQNMAAYENFLKARRLLAQRGQHLADALHLLEKIVQQEPDYAPAWALVAVIREVYFAWNETLDGQPQDFEANLKIAEAAARRAIALDAKLADGYHALANVLRDRGQWLEAEDNYQRAYTLDDRSVELIENYREFLGHVGRWRAATALARRGYELEPGSALAAVALCDSLVTGGKLVEAIGYCRTARQLSADFAWPTTVLVRIELLEGDLDAAYQLDLNCRPCDSIRIGYERRLLAALHDGVEPVTYDQRIFEGFYTPLWFYLGGQAVVLQGLAYDQDPYMRHGRMLFYLNAPYMKPIWRSAQFKQLLIDAGLPAYWRQRGWADICHAQGTDDFECGDYHP